MLANSLYNDLTYPLKANLAIASLGREVALDRIRHYQILVPHDELVATFFTFLCRLSFSAIQSKLMGIKVRRFVLKPKYLHSCRSFSVLRFKNVYRPVPDVQCPGTAEMG